MVIGIKSLEKKIPQSLPRLKFIINHFLFSCHLHEYLINYRSTLVLHICVWLYQKNIVVLAFKINYVLQHVQLYMETTRLTTVYYPCRMWLYHIFDCLIKNIFYNYIFFSFNTFSGFKKVLNIMCSLTCKPKISSLKFCLKNIFNVFS